MERESNLQESVSGKRSTREDEGHSSPAAVSARWLKVCEGAELLEDAVLRFAEGGGSPLQAAVSYLENVLEDFPQPDDPSEGIHAFAVHKLAHSVCEAVVAGGSLIPQSSDS